MRSSMNFLFFHFFLFFFAFPLALSSQPVYCSTGELPLFISVAQVSSAEASAKLNKETGTARHGTARGEIGRAIPTFPAFGEQVETGTRPNKWSQNRDGAGGGDCHRRPSATTRMEDLTSIEHRRGDVEIMGYVTMKLLGWVG
ncbi:hypothetical protein B0J18DRAFT_251025 [Chaetomium sp. MPI-SDFR-AT-0129]|nr:hypothetical protein B0J18DRAFT_251025 [Chaetomium sp. MPI-SDFR-AT-0129]